VPHASAGGRALTPGWPCLCGSVFLFFCFFVFAKGGPLSSFSPRQVPTQSIRRFNRPAIHLPKIAIQPSISTVPCKTLYLLANPMLPFPMFSIAAAPLSRATRGHFANRSCTLILNAINSGSSLPFNIPTFKPSTLQTTNLDAASSISSLFATLTKNTGGGVRPPAFSASALRLSVFFFFLQPPSAASYRLSALHLQLLTPLQSALTRNPSVTRLESALTKKGCGGAGVLPDRCVVTSLLHYFSGIFSQRGFCTASTSLSPLPFENTGLSIVPPMRKGNCSLPSFNVAPDSRATVLVKKLSLVVISAKPR
jgi:hypothetical protein